MARSLLVAGLIGPLQTDQARQRRGIGAFEPQSGVRRVMPLAFGGMIVVIARQLEVAKEALDLELLTSFADLAGPGLVGGVDSIGGLLQKPADQLVGRLENGRPQHLQLLDAGALRQMRRELGHQGLDLGLLGEEDFGGGRFFLTPASRSSRLRSLTKRTYSSTRLWKCS